MWQKVAKAADLENGTGKVVTADGKELALFKYEGSFYALENTCPHRGGPLGEGFLDGPEVTCPWHAWVFDVRTGNCQNVPDVSQPVFKVKVEGDDVLVDLP